MSARPTTTMWSWVWTFYLTAHSPYAVPTDSFNWTWLDPVHTTQFRTKRLSTVALCLIRIEEFPSNLFPFQDRIAGVAKPLRSDREIVKVFKILFDGQTEHIRTPTSQFSRGPIQRIDYRVRQSCSDLLHYSPPRGRTSEFSMSAMSSSSGSSKSRDIRNWPSKPPIFRSCRGCG